jgi:F-type H+-transporting ATPase subunit delta
MAFHADRWAAAFLAVSGENAEGVFLCLKALCAPVKSVHGVFMGHGASAELEKILRESVVGASASAGANAAEIGSSPSVEYAIRFICLLVEKNCFRYIDLFLQRIEQKLDEQKGFLDLSLETASSLDSGFEKELAQMIKEKTGASDVKMKTSVKPELLAGFLLRIGGFYIDASLKGQVESMKDYLTA